MNYIFEPLISWPGPKKQPWEQRRSQFKSSQDNTIKLLEKELSYLDATRIVIQADCDRSSIRADGMVRADRRLRSSGIILSFQSVHGPLSYPCDTYEDWEDNLRAIALALGALRAVDRYGVTRNSEQYRGWAALPAPPSVDHYGIIAKFSGFTRDQVLGGMRDEAIARALRKAHPDVGGSHDDFIAVNAAREAIR